MTQDKPGQVAVKSVDVKKLNKKLKENLYSEIDILKGLHHPHIVALIECHETATHINLVMEFCQLGDLSYFIKKRDTLSRHATTKDMVRKYPNPPAGGLNEVVVRHFLQQLASALEFLRARRFIHRDVKPQNLLLDPSPTYLAKAAPDTVPYAAHEQSLDPVVGLRSLPTLKIADFGFARSLPATSLAETLCGSPLYMAPEILRYEKYDAKADLWSVGTVLYELMVGKAPFRASNHVELLRKIERGEDRIRFPEEAVLSDAMKKLIRSLLRRNPVERLGFTDFFNNTVIKDEIPGLVEDDKPIKKTTESRDSDTQEELPNPNRVSGSKVGARAERGTGLSEEERSSNPGHSVPSKAVHAMAMERRPSSDRKTLDIDSTRGQPQKDNASQPYRDAREQTQRVRRPSMVTHATAPARPDLHTGTAAKATMAGDLQRRASRNSPTSNASPVLDKYRQRGAVTPEERTARETRERAAQDVAFERDYVVVEKRAVEVNALADELAASPKIHGAMQAPVRGGMVRRATTQGQSSSPTGAQVNPSRALQIASGQRPTQMHHRQSSYERRLRDPTSATSAISKAINMASGRLFNMGFSPPLGFGRGPSPPSYSPFPAYPTNQGSLVMIGDGSKEQVPADEDARSVHVIEDAATRSDVVYGFAEVKYKQLVPLAPSTNQGLGLRQTNLPDAVEGEADGIEDDGLTPDAMVTLCEEALVLYVKALSLLARSMDIAGAWWARKTRGEVFEGSAPTRNDRVSSPSPAVGNRVNNVVQWVRGRFNEVLEKAEFVRLKLLEAQKRLPHDHPSHPCNHPSASSSGGSMDTSAENIVVSSGVTAEKLMYDRALEMSRSAAVNELVGEDLSGCEIAYVTAIRMLEAVLEDDEDQPARNKLAAEKDRHVFEKGQDPVNGVEADDREVVLKRAFYLSSQNYFLKAH